MLRIHFLTGWEATKVLSSSPSCDPYGVCCAYIQETLALTTDHDADELISPARPPSMVVSKLSPIPQHHLIEQQQLLSPHPRDIM